MLNAAQSKVTIPYHKLPDDYKGPVKGYDTNLSKYFETKNIQKELLKARETIQAHPKINNYSIDS